MGEPLLHFLVLALLLFAGQSVFEGRNEAVAPSDSEIVIPAHRVEELRQAYFKDLKQFPSDEELQGLIENDIHEEVLYREARKAGLAESPSVVRHCMASEYTMIAYQPPLTEDVSDDELRAYFHENADNYRELTTFTFRQVFLGKGPLDPSLADSIQHLLQQLNDAGEIPGMEEFNTPAGLNLDYRDLPQSKIRYLFGREFGEALETLPIGSWSGPLRSKLGLHAVEMTDKTSESLAPFELIRKRVYRDWRSVTLDRAYRTWFQELRAGYTLRIRDDG